MKQLKRFEITVRETDFVLTLEDEAGQSAEYATSPEQLDLIIDALDELLSENEEFDEDEADGEIYQKPLG